MATPAVELPAGDRTVRVSSPDRVIFPAGEHGPAITKREVVQYYVDVAPGIMRALGERPTAMERWPAGVHPGMRLATGPGDKDAEAFYQKRVPRGAPDYLETATITFPSGRTADEMVPTEIAVVAWAAQMGTLTFHPWPVRRNDVDRPDELRIDLDPQPGTGFADAVRAALGLRDLLEEVGLRGVPKTSGNRGVHVYARIRPEWEFLQVRHAAIALGRELARRDAGVTTAWWKEERGERVFVDFNQNCRDRTIASAWSLRPLPHAPVSMPVAWEDLDAVDPRDFTIRTAPGRLAEHGDPMATLDEAAGSLTPLLEWWERDLEAGLGELNFPPDYPKMPGEPPRVQPSKKVAEHWDEHGNRR